MARAGMALALTVGFAAMGVASAATAPIGSRTSLTVGTTETNGHTVETVTATVLGNDGAPAAGVISLIEKDNSIAGAALDAEGRAVFKLDALTTGEHKLTASYSGDSLHASSQSESLAVTTQTTVTPDFTLSIAPTSLSLTAGDAGTVVATVAPVAGSGFTGFISLSCSGLPAYTACPFSPANLQVTSSTASLTSNMSMETTGPGGTLAETQNSRSPLVLAFVLPGILGLGLLGRKRKLFGGVALLTLVGAMGVLGTTACAARYSYLNHGPHTPGTTPGTYTITVTAQTSNGVTATEHSQTFALTVK